MQQNSVAAKLEFSLLRIQLNYKVFSLYIAALVCLVPVGPYEIYAIFPMNDAIHELKKVLDGKESAEESNVAIDLELNMLPRKL